MVKRLRAERKSEIQEVLNISWLSQDSLLVVIVSSKNKRSWLLVQHKLYFIWPMKIFWYCMQSFLNSGDIIKYYSLIVAHHPLILQLIFVVNMNHGNLFTDSLSFSWRTCSLRCQIREIVECWLGCDADTMTNPWPLFMYRSLMAVNCSMPAVFSVSSMHCCLSTSNCFL